MTLLAGTTAKKITTLILLLSVLLSTACETAERELPDLFFDDYDNRPAIVAIDNPYAAVDWSSIVIHRANLHTHTTRSDGWHSPARVIDRYHSAGYTILALTDHNYVSWPWTRFDRDSQELGMLAIKGNEISDVHHLGSYFTDYNINGRKYRPVITALFQRRADITVEEVLTEIAIRNGLAVFFHPGRYDYNADYYIKYLRRHNHLLGLEVINQKDRYPQDRELWDQVLTALMPERPVWGFANDDFHRWSQFGYSFNNFPLADLTKEAFRKAMTTGSFTFSHGAEAPRITGIFHDVDKNLLKIEAEDYHDIRWISEGRHVYDGPVIPYRLLPALGGYLRAEIYGHGGVSYTNPFGIRRE